MTANVLARCVVTGGLVFLLFASATPSAAQSSKVVRLGYLSSNPAEDTQAALDGFRARMHELGYAEKRNLNVEYRYADGNFDKLPQLARELVLLKVDAIFVYGTPAALAAKNATSQIPVVFAGVNDPLIVGLVQSLRQPGGNVTGVTTNNSELSAKRLSLLKEAVPAVSRVAVVANPDFRPTATMLNEMKVAASPLGVQLHVLEVRKADELPIAFASISAFRAHAIVVLPDPWLLSQRQRVVDQVTKLGIPSIYHLRQYLEVGGLMAYGPSYTESFRQAARLVDRVVKGTTPAELPVEQPWKFELILNVKAAKGLGLTLPQSLVLRADQILN